MKSNFIHVCFVIDESSSMYASKKDVIEGFRKIIDEQKANKEGTCAVSIFRFSSLVKPADFIMEDVNEVSNNLYYSPSGCTALYDGVGTAIDEIGKVLSNMPEDQRPEKNLIVIMTDGEENSSREYQPSRIREMIKHQEDKYNWTFLYIGTDITNANDADRVGIGYKLATTRNKMYKGYNTISNMASCYRTTKGAAEDRYSFMETYLDSAVTDSNEEYKADTGIEIK